MKNRIFMTFFLLIAGILIAVGPHTIFEVCDTSEMVMKCHWSAQAEIGTGLLIITGAILYFLFKDWQSKTVISFFTIAVGIVTILIPKVLIGGCGSGRMPCQSTAFPAIYLISSAIIIFSAVNIFYLLKKQGIRKRMI